MADVDGERGNDSSALVMVLLLASLVGAVAYRYRLQLRYRLFPRHRGFTASPRVRRYGSQMDEVGAEGEAGSARAVGGDDSTRADASGHGGGAFSSAAAVQSPIRMTELAVCTPSTGFTPPTLERQPTPAQTGDFDS